MKKLFAPLALLATLGLVACDDAPDREPAASVQTNPDGSRTLQLNVPESLAPAVDAMANPQATIDNLRSRAGTMTEQMRRDAVVAARRAAEEGARALGQTEAEIRQAGDVAERSARQAAGLNN
ncbi:MULTISPECIES: hypothetical protein [unclassified Devosia]|uniref:hypothetical protein n=1 Tax=unclassified Devosia TaxID=196773 RepID=UPI000FDC3454|nr:MULTISPECIES: hypothetical protein [unclassified Devosia]